MQICSKHLCALLLASCSLLILTKINILIQALSLKGLTAEVLLQPAASQRVLQLQTLYI